MLFLSYFCYAFVRVCLLMPCWSPAGKGLTFWLSFVMSNCEVVTFIWYLGSSGVVLDCIDS